MKSAHYPDSRYFEGLAQQAGKLMVKNFTLGMTREIKSDDTPLTETDTAINRLVVEALERDYPHICVLGEEESRDVSSAEYTVLVDPVDGTIPFCRGIPISSFCISVLQGNQPLSAVIYDPFQKRMWTADHGIGAFLNGERIMTMSQHRTLHKANICMVWWKTSGFNLHEVARALMEKGAIWMNPCSIAYFGGILASGELDATIFPGTSGWETAAMQLLVQESGGVVSDILGNPMQYGPNGEIQGHIMSNHWIHDDLVKLVNECQVPVV